MTEATEATNTNTDNLNYLEYGKCKSCKEETIFQYLGKMGDKIQMLVLYNCLKCKGTFQLNKLEKKVNEIIL